MGLGRILETSHVIRALRPWGRGSLLWQSSLQWAVPARAPSFCSSCSARLWGPTDSVWGTFKDQMRGQDPGRDCLSSEELADLGGGWPMPQGRQRWGLRGSEVS